MNNSNIEALLYITEQARETWLSTLSLDKNVLKATGIGLNSFLREMNEDEHLKNCFGATNVGMIKMFITDAELYGDNDNLTLKTNFKMTQKIFDDVIAKLKA